jgi:hypothetical protein
MGARVATALCCIDGRALPPVQQYLQRNYNAVHVDLITGPAMAAWLAHGAAPQVRTATKMSVEGHGSVAIAIVAHADCIFSPDDENATRSQIRAAMDEVAGWGLAVPIIGLWVDEKRLARKVAALQA